MATFVFWTPVNQAIKNFRRKQSTAIFCWSKFWSWLLQVTHMTHKLLPLVETRLPLAIDNTLYYLYWKTHQSGQLFPRSTGAAAPTPYSLISAGPMAIAWLEYKGQANCSCTCCVNTVLAKSCQTTGILYLYCSTSLCCRSSWQALNFSARFLFSLCS